MYGTILVKFSYENKILLEDFLNKNIRFISVLEFSNTVLVFFLKYSEATQKFDGGLSTLAKKVNQKPFLLNKDKKKYWPGKN